ncbi:hypothetical protein HDR60_02460 [bacterium]|nr:hypothetical protein [bacterium]
MNTVEKNKYYTVEEMIGFIKNIPSSSFFDIHTKLSNDQLLNDMNKIYPDTMVRKLENFPDDEQRKFLSDFINLFEGDTKYYILNRLLFIYDTDVNLYRREIYLEKRYRTTITDIKEKTRILSRTFNELKHIENPSKIFNYFLHNELPTTPHPRSPHDLFQILLNVDILLFNVGRYTSDEILDGHYKTKDGKFSLGKYERIIFGGLDKNIK